MTGQPKPECRRACLRCGGLIPAFCCDELSASAGGWWRCPLQLQLSLAPTLCHTPWQLYVPVKRNTLQIRAGFRQHGPDQHQCAFSPYRNQILRSSGLFGLSFTVINVCADCGSQETDCAWRDNLLTVFCLLQLKYALNNLSILYIKLYYGKYSLINWMVHKLSN